MVTGLPLSTAAALLLSVASTPLPSSSMLTVTEAGSPAARPSGRVPRASFDRVVVLVGVEVGDQLSRAGLLARGDGDAGRRVVVGRLRGAIRSAGGGGEGDDHVLSLGEAVDGGGDGGLVAFRDVGGGAQGDKGVFVVADVHRGRVIRRGGDHVAGAGSQGGRETAVGLVNAVVQRGDGDACGAGVVNAESLAGAKVRRGDEIAGLGEVVAHRN